MGKKRPGMMLYFDWIPSLQILERQEQGELLMAALIYAQTGRKPVFTDRLMLFAWNGMQTRIDADEERYAQKVQQNAEAANRRWSGKKNQGDTSAKDTADHAGYYDEADRILMEAEMRAQRKNADASN